MQQHSGDANNDRHPITPACRGWGCFQKDWCARWVADPPPDLEVFEKSPIDQFGRCEHVIEVTPPASDTA